MNDSDQFFDWQLQLTHYRDPNTKLGFWVGTFLRQEKRGKTRIKRLKSSGAPWRVSSNYRISENDSIRRSGKAAVPKKHNFKAPILTA